jgi:hypothetical protein
LEDNKFALDERQAVLTNIITVGRAEDGDIGFGKWRQRREPGEEEVQSSGVGIGRAAETVLTRDRVTNSVGELAVSIAAKRWVAIR